MAETRRRLKRRARHPLTDARELPECLGPKLQSFKPRYAPIKWIERLDGDEACDGPSGTQGFIFKVEIESREYAIKVFKFYDPMPDFEYWSPFLDKSVTSEALALHMDPFYAECRAYGKIHGNQKLGSMKKDIVVPCHGFRFLETHDEHDLVEKFGIDLKRGAEESLPARAILKDLALGDSGVDDKSIVQILRDIHQMNKAGIYNKDIRVENFKNAKLVDFGSAWTEPHCVLGCLDQGYKSDAIDERVEDLVQFDQMVEENEIRTKLRAMS